MDIKEALEHEHSKAQTDRITKFIGNDKTRFKVLVSLFLGDDYRTTQRAAWPLAYCSLEHPELLEPYQTKLLQKLKEPNQHDAVKRNILRVWAYQMPPIDLWGELFDVCYTFTRSKDEPGAIRAFSMHVMSNITLQFPELATELRSLVEDLMPIGTPAIISRGKKVLKLLDKL
jgi:hypothetical protein